jgi:hypothetical protein
MSALFCDITRRRAVIVYRRFGTTYRSHLPSVKSRFCCRILDPWRWYRYVIPETSVKDYHTTPRNIPEQGRSHQRRGRSLKSSCTILVPPRPERHECALNMTLCDCASWFTAALTFPSTKTHVMSLIFNPPQPPCRYSDSLRAPRSGDRIPVRVRFAAPVQTGTGAHPATCTMGTGSLPGVKRPGRGASHPTPF